MEDIAVGIDTAIPCGLIINELVSNALKHTFPEDKKGEILVRVCSVNRTIKLTVKDNWLRSPSRLFWHSKGLPVGDCHILEKCYTCNSSDTTSCSDTTFSTVTYEYNS